MRLNHSAGAFTKILAAVLAVLMAACMMSGAALAAPAASGTLQFMCKDSAGFAVPGVSLALFTDEAMSGKAGSGTADANGVVRIMGLGTATYWVTVASVPEGFEKPDVRIPVDATDGKVTQYTLMFQKTGVASETDDSNASLSGLSASGGKLSPAFSSSTTAYTLTLPNTLGWVKVTPKLASRHASYSIAVNGRRAGRTLTLRAGEEKTMLIRVKAQAGNTNTYTVKIRRSISHSADLAAISLNGCSVQPAFSKGVTAYSAALPATKGTVTLSIRKADVYQRYWVYMNGRLSGKTIRLNPGETKTVKVAVKAQAGETKTYVIQISRSK